MTQRFWPLARGHMITSGFGPRSGGFHYGTDFGREGGSGGMAVHAVQGGTVVMVGPASGFGQWVVVDHPTEDGGGTTVYGHVLPEVADGQRVEAGQRIARINPDSNTNGGVPPHLHLEWHRYVWVLPGPDRLDPRPLLQGAAYPDEPAPPEEVSVTQFGVDISNWQAGLNLGQVAREDFRAVIAKVSEGAGFRDHTWPGFRDAARAAGLPVMGYHYLQAGDSIEAQADTFVRHLGDTSVPAMIDAEIGSGGVDVIRAFRDAVERRGVRVALLYLPRWYWQGHIGSPDLTGLPPLMASSYGSDRPGFASALYPGDHDPAWNGYGGLPVAVLQFTQRAQVAGQQIDAWAHRGTPDQLAALFGAHTPQEDDMTEEDRRMLRAVYEALCAPRPSLVEGSTAQLDAPTFIQCTDAATYRTERMVADIKKKLEA